MPMKQSYQNSGIGRGAMNKNLMENYIKSNTSSYRQEKPHIVYVLWIALFLLFAYLSFVHTLDIFEESAAQFW